MEKSLPGCQVLVGARARDGQRQAKRGGVARLGEEKAQVGALVYNHLNRENERQSQILLASAQGQAEEQWAQVRTWEILIRY